GSGWRWVVMRMFFFPAMRRSNWRPRGLPRAARAACRAELVVVSTQDSTKAVMDRRCRWGGGVTSGGLLADGPAPSAVEDRMSLASSDEAGDMSDLTSG